MIFKISVSLSLAAAVFVASGTSLGFWTAGLLLTLGYHRNVLVAGDHIHPWRVGSLTPPATRVRYTLWAVPLGPARSLSVRPRGRRGRRGRRSVGLALELLPLPLAWAARRLGA